MNEEGKKFRYTQKQRSNEMKIKRNKEILDTISKTEIIRGKSIKEKESELAKYNAKTCDFKKFKEYIDKKLDANYDLHKQYEKPIYRKFRLDKYIKEQVSESKMLNNFEKKYGLDTIVVIGDFDKPKGMKGKESCITKKLREIFERKYDVYLINEYNTSKLCNICECEVERFWKREVNKKDKKKK